MLNHRIMIWTTAPTSDTPANNVLGQSSFTNQISACTQNGLTYPTGMRWDGTDSRLYVPDSGCNRALSFDSFSDFSNANKVYGQPDFVSDVPAPLRGTLGAEASITGLE